MDADGFEVLELDWQGPVDMAAVGATPADVWDGLQGPGVYLMVMSYADHAGVYVGLSKNVLDRVRSHVAATMGLTYGLRDYAGDWRYEPAPAPRYFEQFSDAANLAEISALAQAEVRRTKWFFAAVEDARGLPYVEGVLIRHVRGLAAGGVLLAGRRIKSDNGNAGSQPTGPLMLRNTGADDAVSLLGDVVQWPMEQAA